MNGATVTKHGQSRFWAVHDATGDLVCVCVYKRGAVEVARRLALAPVSDPSSVSGAACLREDPPEASREQGRALSEPAGQG